MCIGLGATLLFCVGEESSDTCAAGGRWMPEADMSVEGRGDSDCNGCANEWTLGG